MLTPEICEAILRDHSRKPRHSGSCECGLHEKTVNPACGDEVELSLSLDESGENLACLKFTGAGCAASQSSASLWVSRLQGVPVSQAVTELEKFCQMVDNGEGNPEVEYDTFEEVAALFMFSRIPARQRCATLAPRLLLKMIQQLKAS